MRLSAQQVPMLTFPIKRSSIQSETNNSTTNNIQNEITNFYADGDQEMINIDGPPRTSDLYNPELNLTAHRTAQEVIF